MTDPIADMLNRIRNAQAVNKKTVDIPFSKLKYEIGKVLEKSNLIEKLGRKGRKTEKFIEIEIKYKEEKPVIYGLRRISKPGRKVYIPYKEIKKVKAGYGLAIISTSKGLMTDKEARNRKIGGEIICEIW